MSNLNDIKIYRYENNCFFETVDQIIEETQISIFLNNKLYLKVLGSNNNLENLAIGVLFSESVIQTIDDVASITLEGSNIYVSVKNPNLIDRESVRTSGFGAGIISNKLLLLDKKFDNSFSIKAVKIIDLMNNFNTRSKTFIATGAVHSCLIYVDNKTIFEEDIGRHNALDKVIGYSIINKIDLKNAILLTTGRISAEMLLKTAKSGISVIISRSAPTSKALYYAKRFNMTLVGFARSGRFNIYNGHEKIQP